jgi:hypothetical protein
MIDWKWPPCFAKPAGFVHSKYPVVSVSGDAAGSTCVHNGRMRRPVVSPRWRAEEVRDNHAARRAKSDALMFGSSLADVFRVPAYDCRAVGPDQSLNLP